MSVVKDRESQVAVKERRQVRHAPVQRPVVRTKPAITVRTRYIERPVTRPSIWPDVLAKGAVFACVAVSAFFMSSLSGHVMVEKSRKELSDMRGRTIAAKKAESIIRERVDLLTRADKVEEWAMAHGMAPIDGLGATHGPSAH